MVLQRGCRNLAGPFRGDLTGAWAEGKRPCQCPPATDLCLLSSALLPNPPFCRPPVALHLLPAQFKLPT